MLSEAVEAIALCFVRCRREFCVMSGMMRRVVAEATWHTRHRAAFGAPLAQQPAMVNVLADIALEAEAATVSAMRVARAFDSDDPDEATFRRLALAVMKYWVC